MNQYSVPISMRALPLLKRLIVVSATLSLGLAAFNLSAQSAAPLKVDAQLMQTSIAGTLSEGLIEVKSLNQSITLDENQNYLDKRKAWVQHLQTNANQAQASLLKWLKANHVEHKVFWINNTIYVRASQATLLSLAAREDVVFIYGNPSIPVRQPQHDLLAQKAALLAGPEWGVTKINAPKVWAAGFTGQGVTIAGEDTGYKWDHPAIKAKYRGWNGSTANHNYNWHDAAHSGTSVCAPNGLVPCDDHGHGTHTVGTMVGDDGAGNQIGVAPGAKWIGCRNMIGGAGTPATYIECLQWLIAPTDLNGNNPDPSKAPDISSHSWGCTVSEGCTSANVLKAAVDNVVKAGIMVVAAAGNDGSGCNTISDAPGIYDSAFTIASTTSTDTMSSFSSRGPVAGALTNKPDVAAPGSNVRSAWNNNAYNTISGTSMATPHVAGAAALLISANPALRGHPDQIAALLRASAVTTVSNSQSCGGIAATKFPNPVVGAGRIDAYAAVMLATSKPTVLTNGVAKTGLAASKDAGLSFTLDVTAGATGLKFVSSGGTGDADMYVKFGSMPTTSTYDCKSDGSSNSETCNIATAKAGTYYVLIKAYATFSGMSLTGSFVK